MKKTQGTIASTVRRPVRWLTRMSYVNLALVYGGMILCCGFVFFLLSEHAPSHAPTIPQGTPFLKFLNAVYFSVITAASVGYGDIVPQGISKIIASFEGLFSLFVFAILVSKPISEREEAALEHIHKLTVDDIFTTIREGFYIMRRDFERVSTNVELKRTLSAKDAEDFETALRHGQVLLEDIPTFYSSEEGLYTFDGRKEKLLAEGLLRTFVRLRSTLLLVRSIGPLPSSSVKALQELLSVGKESLKRWKEHSSSVVHARIDESTEILTSLQA